MSEETSVDRRPPQPATELVVTFDVDREAPVFEDDDATTRLPAEAAWLDRPRVVQGFRLGRKLSCVDGVATYEAEEVATGRAAVVEWLPRLFVDYPRVVRRLYTEAQLVQRLEHPNLTELVHADEDPAGCAIAYARPTGAATLEAVARRLEGRVQALPVGLAAHVAAEVCRALAYIVALPDRAGRPLDVGVYRVSPRVVLLGADGAVRLCTWGLRLAPDRAGPPTAWVEDVEAPYVAPECLLGEPWTPRAAAYAVGVMLYELLVGHPAYAEARPEAWAARVLDGGPPLDALAAEAVPAALVELVAWAIAARPEARAPGPEALAEALEAWLESAPPSDAAVLARFLGAEGLLEPSPTPAAGIAVVPRAPWGIAGAGTRSALSALVVAERPDPGLGDDDEATVRGDIEALERVLAVVGRPVAPSVALHQRLPVGAPIANDDEAEGAATRRGHVIPAVLLSPIGPAVLPREAELASTTRGRPPVEPALALEPAGPTLVPEPAPKRSALPLALVGAVGIVVLLVGMVAGLALGGAAAPERPGVVELTEAP